jgi:bifunctional UDP-N-acetylglucosamine pyrophosphorylase/glucosamine-1-phosphate N-acetyltransferase
MHRTAVILAAGKGSRLEPLTTTVPKPLIKIAGETVLSHNMRALAPYVDAYVLVVGYMADAITASVGDMYAGKPVTYVVQKQPLGTGDALRMTRDAVHTDSFFMIYGDDLYDPQIFELMQTKKLAVAGKIFENWHQFGILQAKENGYLHGIVEKPKEFIGNNVNIGVYLFDRAIFNYFEDAPLSLRGEYELTDIVTRYCVEHDMEIVSVEGYWLTIGYPWHILQANALLLHRIQPQINGEIEPNVVIKGTVRIGAGTVVKSGTYIDGNVIIGENCVIGPHTYIRGNVAIGDMCRIGSSVEIEHSSIGNHVNIEHLSFVGYSVLGNNIILGGGTVTADRRHDRKSIRVNSKEQLVDTGLYHLGAIIGDFVRTGVHTSIYPGRKMHYHSYTAPGEIVKQDKLSSHEIELK